MAGRICTAAGTDAMLTRPAEGWMRVADGSGAADHGNPLAPVALCVGGAPVQIAALPGSIPTGRQAATNRDCSVT